MPRLPEWFKSSYGKREAANALQLKLAKEIPNSVCQEAKCPNRSECWKHGTLTFLILGTSCTRSCGFCSVSHDKSKLTLPDKKEIKDILHAIAKLQLKYVVLTSPTRDDLDDGGASHYAEAILAIKEKYPNVKVEVLIPDFNGNKKALDIVIKAKPDVLNHNIETVAELYSKVRPGADYYQSLELLKYTKNKDSQILTKTGLIVGLGETTEQIKKTFEDCKEYNIDIMTIGQYLKPTNKNLEVAKYYSPEEFEELKNIGLNKGIKHILAGPLVRSSFLAENVFEDVAAIL